MKTCYYANMNFSKSNQTAEEEVETLFSALADKTRLRLLNLMGDDEICVCFFTEVLGESQPKVSRHLAYLRKAGLVDARREGKWMHYSIRTPEDPQLRKVIRSVLEWIASRPEMAADYLKLKEVCCSTDLPKGIASAPKPDIAIGTDMFEGYESESEEVEVLETYLL